MRISIITKGPVAQTGRVSAWHAGGRGFKSRPVHHFHFLNVLAIYQVKFIISPKFD